MVFGTAVAMVFAFGSIAGAVHSNGSVNNDLFELGPTAAPVTGATDATNIIGNQAAGPDWDNLCDANGVSDGFVHSNIVIRDDDDNTIPDAFETYGGRGVACIGDDLSVAGAVDRTIFAESNKNNDDPDTWNWDTGNVPVKDDLSNVYGFAIEDEGDLIIYAGLERLSPNGDSHVDIEFTQQEIVLDKDSPCDGDGVPEGDTKPCEFFGERTENDLIVSLDYTNGGALGSLEIRRWTGTTYEVVFHSNGTGCNDTDDITDVAADAICGFTNEVPIDGGVWVNFNSHAAVIEDLPTNAFAEFGVNVNEVFGLSEVPCFSTINAHTRSSQSFTAELKDFATARFELCAPSTDVGVSADVTTIHGGDSVTFTYTEENDGIDPLHPPVPGDADPTQTDGNGGWVVDDGCTPVLHTLGSASDALTSDATHNIGDLNNNNVLDPGETWTFTCTTTISATQTNTVIAHGIDKRFDPDVDVTYCTDGIGPGGTGLNGDGEFCDPDERAQITITVINPSTALVKTAQATITFRYYETNDEAGGELTAPVPGDASPTQTDGNGGWVVDDNCSPVLHVLGSTSDSLDSDATHNIGDLDNDNKLDGGETWVFNCVESTTEGADFNQTNTATGHGIDAIGDDVTYCTTPTTGQFCDTDERDAVTVTITHASPNPSPLPSPG
ncbi:MAG TPA: hypothetical protein VGB52_01625 [Actinomycetota bacterium]